ncbi:MAG: hypothetical protein HY326_11005 [Chloroflexi bacterium]|nr:hypothetical protein [Chloroflexota bacterium]
MNQVIWIDEPVTVVARMDLETQTQPLFFEWRSEQYTIRDWGRSWQEETGNGIRYHFLVSTTPQHLYELTYEPSRSAWRLRRAWEPEPAV